MRQIFIAGALAIGIAAPVLAQRDGPAAPQARAEYQARQKRQFAAIDANGDGIVTRDELSAQLAARLSGPPPAPMLDAIFRRIDTDGDGKATAAEADAASLANFDRWDTDHDGLLSSAERRAGQISMMQGMRPPRPPK